MLTLKLFDRADGVEGHFCIGYTDEQGTSHFWGRTAGDKHGFCAAGVVFVGAEAAEAALDAIAALVRAEGLVEVWCSAADRYAHLARVEALPEIRATSVALMEARMEAARALKAALHPREDS